MLAIKGELADHDYQICYESHVNLDLSFFIILNAAISNPGVDYYLCSCHRWESVIFQGGRQLSGPRKTKTKTKKERKKKKKKKKKKKQTCAFKMTKKETNSYFFKRTFRV